MAIAYTKTAFPKIEEKLLKVINDEFPSIYISSDYVAQPTDESIRIHLSSSEDVLTTSVFERRIFNIEIVHYYLDKDSIHRTEYVRNRCDRLKKLLNSNRNISGYWFDLQIPSIEYDIETDIENLSVTQLSVTLENHDSL
jgi:hypothetical protein